MALTIALLGLSGSGKGTLAAHLREWGFETIAPGTMFQQQLQSGSALGILAKKYINANEMVPDEVVDAMIEEAISHIPAEKAIALDGFPRSREQAIFLDALLNDRKRRLDMAFYLDVPDEVAAQRVLDTPGALHPGDTQSTITARHRRFHRMTERLAEYYGESGRFAVIDTSGSIKKATEALDSAVQDLEEGALEPSGAAELATIRSRARSSLSVPHGQARSTTDIVLLGGPGSGKGTQAARLSEALNLPHIATGDLFRENLRKQTKLGKLAESYMNRGDLVPDDVTEAMVQDRLRREDVVDGLLLDGFPRSLSQAQALTDILATERRRLRSAVYLRVSDSEIVERLSGRLVCRECGASFHRRFKPPQKEGICDECGGELYQRDDDKPETIRNRLRNFHRLNKPLLAYYAQAGILRVVDGEGDLQKVTQRMLGAVRL